MWMQFDSHRRTGFEENSINHDDFQLASWTDSGLEKVQEIAGNCENIIADSARHTFFQELVKGSKGNSRPLSDALDPRTRLLERVPTTPDATELLWR